MKPITLTLCGWGPFRDSQTVDFTKLSENGIFLITGQTGAGKTTMVKLLMRFYDVNKGAIKVDGHDVRNFNRSELHEMFGMVLQDTWLFSGTIMENIRYGKLDATDEEIIQAAKQVSADLVVNRLEQGYDSEVGESGGSC